MCCEGEMEMMNVVLNDEGEDFIVQVDRETATTLLNDPKLAREYIEAAKRYFNNPVETDEYEEFSREDASEQDDQDYSEDMCISHELLSVWNGKGKPTDADHEATSQLLKLREEKNSLFADKKTNKNKLWTQIAELLKGQGFNVDATKCRQKFANLQKGCIKFRDNMRTTGGKKKDPPPYYDELHAILGSKDKSNPKGLQDSFSSQVHSEIADEINHRPEADMEVDPGNIADCEKSHENKKDKPTTSRIDDSDENPKNRFKDSSRRIEKPRSLGFTVLQEIQKQYREKKRRKETSL